MRKILFLWCISMVYISNAHSQILEPVKWSYSVKKTSGTTAIIYIKATIDKGWHLYSQTPSDGGPTATQFTFFTSKSFSKIGKTIEPKPITKFEPAFFMEISYFENSVIFQQKVMLLAKDVVIKCNVEFMACNDKKCLPPSVKEFSVPVKR